MRRALGWTAVGLTAAAVPLVTANTYYLYLAMTVAIFVVVTCGLNVLAGLNGQISLGHAGLYAIGAYAAALGATRLASASGPRCRWRSWSRPPSAPGWR